MTQVRRRCAGALVALALAVAPSPARAHGDLHEQIVALSAEIERHPHDARLWHKRGELRRAHAEYQAALRDYTRAEQLDPTLAVVHLSRGRALLETKRYELAVAALDRFLARMPAHTEGLLLRARALSRVARRDAAERDYAAALASAADPLPDLFLERAENLTAAGAGASALEVLATAEARLGPLVVLQQAALAVERQLGHYDAALARLDRMLAVVERKESLLAQRAGLLDEAGQAELARQARRDALAAIAALPERTRALPSTRRLESELRVALAPPP